MITKINTAFVIGIEGNLVSVEVNIENGFPRFNIVGLGDTSVKESKERVRASIINSGFKFPVKNITVNLAPADIKKAGSLFDLPIAIGILCATGQINFKDSNEFMIFGELSLSGNLNKVKGALPIAIQGFKNGIKNFIIPMRNAEECSILKGVRCYPLESLRQVVHFIVNRNIPPYSSRHKNITSKNTLDFSDVLGQESCKRAIEVAASGNHGLLMLGPPGSGKTMIAERIPTILPKLSYSQSLEVTKIYSAAGMLDKENCLIKDPPFRNPHHTITTTALIGGGSSLTPGEVSLAHNGILFLDEILEFKRQVVESLRQPIENDHLTISRINGKVNFPCEFMTVLAANPCRCGNFGSSRHCSCTEHDREKYISKLSSPILDRMDIFTFVNSPDIKFLQNKYPNENSKNMAQRVKYARELQAERFRNESISCNSQMKINLIKKYCNLSSSSSRLLNNIFLKYNLSMRAYNKILKVSRTIADLDKSSFIKENHIIESIFYRKFINNKII